jgi:staphylococcal nuclease domain-containing protein 1
LGKDVNVTF